jgi:chemotaxis protein methyltransferase CheR
MTDMMNDLEFEKYKKLISDSSGITFTNTNRSILESRLRERLRNSPMKSVSDYFAVLQRDSEELKSFLDSVTTNLTRFFRNIAHIDAFEKFVIPALIKQKKESGQQKIIKVWSAGCSTGEEPYTLAVVLQEKLPPDFSYQLIASDISLKSLMIAKEGVYPENRMDSIPPIYMKYFEKRDSNYRIRDDVKKNIRFDYHNLKFDSGQRQLDVVFCRNVLIYFDMAAQKEVVDRFWDAMSPRSFLFIGHSESLFGMETKFEFLRTDWACIYKKETK